MALTRLMGMDYGSVRIGIALSDPLQIIAEPYCVLQNDGAFLSNLHKILKKKFITKIILGLPINIAGEDTEKTKEVREFYHKLRSEITIPIEFWDERYSSNEAKMILRKMKYSPQEGRKIIDKIAASLILKDYLENHQ